MSSDLKAEFPDMKGFSVTNLKYCRRFYELYSQSNIIRQQLIDELDSVKRHQLVTKVYLWDYENPNTEKRGMN